MSQPDFLRPAYVPIEPSWTTISGMSRSGTYEALGRGDLKAIKVGNKTLIDVEHGLAWLRSRPAAQIAPPRRRDRMAEAA